MEKKEGHKNPEIKMSRKNRSVFETRWKKTEEWT